MANSPTRHSTKLSNSRVLVLGGTSGIGFAVASAALEQGAHVVISGSNPERLEHALARLRDTTASGSENDRRITGYTCDLSNPEKVEENVLALLRAATGSVSTGAGDSDAESALLDHIVFTAGDVMKLPTIENVTVEQIQNSGNVRILGAFMIAKHAPQYMQPASSSSSSSITVTGGIKTTKPGKGWAVAAAMGGAVEAMARALAVDLAPIRVNCVVVGVIHTELLSQFFTQETLGPALDQYASQTLVGRAGKPEDVAEAYIYLMKDNFCTGSLIHTNGGMLLK